ncbi:hypothetical protein [Mucilaginibacter sp.]|uniref:hypothetical protein n=1 Tax=Mucilaginibacter sp. TaxID=1882438 RepID=UPI0035BC8621
MKTFCTTNWLISIALTGLLLLTGSNIATAQTDTIRLKDKGLNTATLKPGLRQYLVYFQMPKSPKTLRFWLWLRDTKVENRNGEKLFVTTQHWYGSDTISYRSAYSVNRQADFSPVYHSETVAGKNKAYNWGATKIISADTVSNNSLKNFTLDFTTPNYNWNLDIETFEMLPLAAGKIFAINFYDAGIGKPDYIIYKVSGSEVITTYDNQKIDCWKLANESEFRGQKAYQTFWISKKNHEFLKEEDSFPGGYRYKIKLPATANGLLSRFAN